MDVPNPANNRTPRLDYLRAARTERLLTGADIPVLQRLREMMNLATHSVDPGITITDALRYYNIADALIQKITQEPNKK
jgi:hypothetical protein